PCRGRGGSRSHGGRGRGRPAARGGGRPRCGGARGGALGLLGCVRPRRRPPRGRRRAGGG
ncbi:unnamed protein product, partial [Prorocentrum cordatum]